MSAAPMPDRGGQGLRLRGKLLLAQLPLVAGLVGLGVVGNAAISRLGESAQRILSENYRSVLAAQRMTDAIEQIDRTASSLAGGRRDPLPSAAASRASFESELKAQEGNITEPGERESTERVRSRWTDYQRRFDRFAALADPAELRARYGAEMEPSYLAVRKAVDEVLALNEDAMVRKSGEAQRSASRLETVLLALAAALLLAGIIGSALFTTRLLRPLSVLSQAVRRLGEGDPLARAQVDGTDEVAQLAHELNTMADRIEEYRRSSLGELLQAQAAAQAAIDSLPDPVVVLRGDGEVLNVNLAAERTLKLALGPLGQSRDVDPRIAAALAELLRHVAQGKGAFVPHGFDAAIPVPIEGGERHFLPRAAPLHDEAGQVAGATVVLEDVTRLMRFDELKSDMVATVAHEFRTPLTSLRMAIYLCCEETVGPLNDKQGELLRAAREDTERLQTIVDELLDLSRIQSGALELHRRRIPIEPLVRSVAEPFAARAAERRIALAVEVPPDAGELEVDADRLLLVFDNLLSNALRHTPDGGTLALRAAPSPTELRFEVQDSGPGVAPELREAIFQKFFRGPGPSRGAGLGLYIAKEIVQAHGGAIGVDSAPGRGSTFWFTLPRPPARPA